MTRHLLAALPIKSPATLITTVISSRSSLIRILCASRYHQGIAFKADLRLKKINVIKKDCPIIEKQKITERAFRQQNTIGFCFSKLRDSTKGELIVEIAHRRVWLWDKNEAHAQHWHLLARRKLNAPETCKYTLSNAPAETGTQRLAQRQGQRFWIERAFEEGKSKSGMASYQARKWRSWHHHMALVSMAVVAICCRETYELRSLISVKD